MLDIQVDETQSNPVPLDTSTATSVAPMLHVSVKATVKVTTQTSAPTKIQSIGLHSLEILTKKK